MAVRCSMSGPLCFPLPWLLGQKHQFQVSTAFFPTQPYYLQRWLPVILASLPPSTPWRSLWLLTSQSVDGKKMFQVYLCSAGALLIFSRLTRRCSSSVSPSLLIICRVVSSSIGRLGGFRFTWLMHRSLPFTCRLASPGRQHPSCRVSQMAFGRSCSS